MMVEGGEYMKNGLKIETKSQKNGFEMLYISSFCDFWAS
jgi:hypothetical protein